MSKQINLRDPCSRAHWSGHFGCSELELINAIRAIGSREIGAISLYLATRFEKKPGAVANAKSAKAQATVTAR